jgi:hypothetical protein
VRRVKRVGVELQITREVELVRGGVGVGGGHGEQAALAGDRDESGAARWRAFGRFAGLLVPLTC